MGEADNYSVEYVRYRLKSHKSIDLVQAYEAASEHLRAAPECLGYELSECEEEREIFILRILWSSTQAHVERFRKGPEFPPFLAIVLPFIEEIEEMRHYETTEVIWRRT